MHLGNKGEGPCSNSQL